MKPTATLLSLDEMWWFYWQRQQVLILAARHIKIAERPFA